MRRRPPFVIFVLVALGACAPITEPLGMRDPFHIYHPYEGEGRTAALASVTASRPVAIAAVASMSEADRIAFDAALQPMADARDVLLVSPEKEHAFTLAGVFRRDPAEGKTESATILWTLDGVAGEAFEARVQWPREKGETADTLPARAVAVLAEQTIAHLARLTSPMAAEHVAETGAPVIAIAGPAKAPGDGEKSLPPALRAVLSQHPSLHLADAGTEGDIRILCEVTLTAAKDLPQAQDIVIVWRAVTRDGTALGEVRQDNRIPKGALDGAWGAIALDIANAAAPGIVDLLRRAGVPGA